MLDQEGWEAYKANREKLYISNRKFKRITKKKSDKEIEMKHVQATLAELVIIKQINEN